jgi:tRNA uridine 5-carboxymethylaminomethyl modification enzyme
MELLSFNHISWDDLCRVWPVLADVAPDIQAQLSCDALYAAYMPRHEADIASFRRDEEMILPRDLDYAAIGSLSNEICQKLRQVQPATLGAAARIPGVTPAAVIALLRHVRRKNRTMRDDAHAA